MDNQIPLGQQKGSKTVTQLKEQVQELFGLTDHETRLYLELLLHQQLTATEAARLTGIRRSRVYDITKDLKEKDLIEIENTTPMVFVAKSPREVVDRLIDTRERELREKNAAMLEMLESLQSVWMGRRQETLGRGMFLLSEQLVREVIPLELDLVQNTLCLAIRGPPSNLPHSLSATSRFFNHDKLDDAIDVFMEGDVKFRFLLGNSELFLEKSLSERFRALLRGMREDVIEVRDIGENLPHSFLLVDSVRVYVFFSGAGGTTHREVVKAENQSLVDMFVLLWDMLWEKGEPLTMDMITGRVIEKS